MKDIHDDIRDAHTEYSKKKFYHSITKSILAQQSRSPSFFSFIQRAAHNAWYHLARLEALHQAPHVSRELIMREMSIPSLASNPFAIGATAIGAAVGTLAVCKTCRVKTCGWCTRLFHFSARLGRKVRQDIVSIVEYISRITPNIHIATPSLLRGYIPFTESVAFLSNIKLPRIALPSIRLPKISLPQLKLQSFALPRFTLPRLQFSKLIIPSFSLPTIQRPRFSFPKLRQVFKNYYHSFSRNEAIQPIHIQRIGGGLGYFFKHRLPRKISGWKKHYVIEFVVLAIVLGTVGVFMSIYADTTSNRGNMPIVYQGRLMDANYIPKSDSTYYLAFEIYTASSGGTCKWRTETTQDGSCAGSDLTALSATTSRGLFTVTLGAGAADNPTFGFNFDATASYLQVYVCPSATPNTTGSCETLTPRKQIGGVTYSYNSDLLDGLNYTDFLQLSPTTNVQTLAFTGVATNGVTITGNSLTTGKALVLSSSSLTSGILMDLQVSGTAAAASQTALNILTAGATATNGITTYGAQISNTHTNATSGTNVALYLNASGATTANYGLIVNAGSVGIGTTTPSYALDVNGSFRSTSGFINARQIDTISTGSLTAAINTTYSGWYRIARSTIASSAYGVRGGVKTTITSTGNNLTPKQDVIYAFKDWTTNLSLNKIENYNGSLFTKFRIALDTNYAYLEGFISPSFNYTDSESYFNVVVENQGYTLENWTAYNETLTAGLSSPTYSDELSVITNGTSVSTMYSEGKVLIGGITAYGGYSGQLETQTSGASGGFVASNWQNANSESIFQFQKSRSGTIGTHTSGVPSSGDSIGSILFDASDNTGFEHAAIITAEADGTWGDNDAPGRIVFKTTTDGTNSTAERMRIDNAGNVGIGTTAPGAITVVNRASSQGNTPPAAGSHSAHFEVLIGNAYGLLMGPMGTGNSYIQAQRVDGTATTYNLLLQPNGGTVGIGVTAPTGILQVTGRTSAFGITNFDNTLALDSDYPGIAFGSAGSGARAIIRVNNTTGTATGDGRLSFYTATSAQTGTSSFTEAMTITDDGDVGIGMTPSAKLDITQATVGNQVLGLTSTATNDDPNYKVYQGRVATTDDTLTTINTIALTASNTYIIEARIIGRTVSGGGVGCSADNGAGYVVRGTYKQVGGTASLIGSVQADYTAESDSTWNATLNVSSGNVLVQVTGSVATCNITWHSTVSVSNVGS